MSHWTPLTIWWVSSCCESLRLAEWWVENTASVLRSPSERSSSGCPVFWVIVPGCSPNSCGTSPNLWVQKKLIKLKQSTQHTWLRPADYLWKFFSDSLFNVFTNPGDVLLCNFWIKCVLRLTVPCFFRCFSRNFRSFYLIPQSWHDSEGNVMSVVKTELIFYSITSANISSYYEGKFQREQTDNDFKNECYTKG